MRRIIVVLAMLVAVATVLAIPTADADDGDSMLLDYGNGSTVWIPTSFEGTYMESAKSALDSAGIDHIGSGSGMISIGGMTEYSVGTQQCSWRLYLWTDDGWVHSEGFS